MASNKDRGSLPLKKNSCNKKNKENQRKLIDQLTAIFGSTFDADVILSVAQNCHWKLNKSIDALISMSASDTISEQVNNIDFVQTENADIQPWLAEDFSAQSKSNQTIFQNINCAEHEDFCKFQQMEHTNTDSNPQKYNESSQKIETASLCGLKVQYRPRGMENNSDDDADVVIEEESSEYRIDTPEPEHINVCQFLSASTQCPPKTTFSKVNYISTPSPPSTPNRKISEVENKSSIGLNQLEIDIQKGYKILILMRGVSGSGKTYLARKIITKTSGSDFKAHIFSADDYFLAINKGVYKFDASKLHDAHSYNQNRVLNAMRESRSPIIVDNTNTQIWEMQQYAIMAVQFGYIVETLEPNTSWFRNLNELDKRNEHNLPKAKIRMMLDRYESNINGERLLRMLNLHYAPDNTPPQMRKIPPPPTKIQELKLNAEFHQSHNQQPENTDWERLFDPNFPFTTGEMEDLVKTMNLSKHYKKSKTKFDHENSPLDLAKLGAIGCERRRQPTETILVEIDDDNLETKQEDPVISSSIPITETATLLFNAIGSERKTSVHDIEVREECGGTDIQSAECKVEHVAKGHGLSQCWDFTTLHDSMQIQNKPVENKLAEKVELKKTFHENSDNIISVSTQKNDEVTFQNIQDHDQKLLSNKTKVNVKELMKVEANAPKEESLETNLSSKELNTKITSSTSSSSSSLEKVSDVDISQFEICNSQEEVPEISAAVDNDACNTFTDKEGVGLGSLLNYLKNSFMGNEKEKVPNLEKTESSDEPESVSIERLPSDEESGRSSPLKNSPELSSLLLTSTNAGPNTLSLSSTNSSPQEILNCDIHEAPIEPLVQNTLLDISVTSEEFFEANDQIDTDISNKENTINVVQQLLEASSDFQHTEQLNREKETIIVTNQDMQNMNENNLTKLAFAENMKNSEVLDSGDEEISRVTKELIDKTVADKNIYHADIQKDDNAATSKFSIDNINLISWRETPFPIDDLTTQLSSVQLSVADKKSDLITCEKETFTDPYDFNVAYVGGVGDYKVLEAFSRSINEIERDSPNELEMLAPTHKLMLHKGTMTNNSSVFYKDTIFDLASGDIEVQNRSTELMDLFPHLSSICVLDIYENFCNRDFNWALEYLSNLQDGDPDIYATDEFKNLSEETILANHNKTEQRNKRQRSKQLNIDSLELQRQFESKIVMSQDSYSPHILRVKRWKNRQFDIPDSEEPEELQDLMSFDAQEPPIIFPVANTAATTVEAKKASRLDHPAMEEEEIDEEEEYSLEEENEETMELQLGYEFVRVLESEFGSSGIQTPDGLFPVIQIRRSMAQELHALWIESMQRQLWVMQDQLDNRIAKDAEYAKSLEDEEEKTALEPDEPNLKEIMDMEMALAACLSSNNRKKVNKDSLKDLTTRVVQQTLHEMFPDYDVDILLEIYEAHDRNFEETVKVIEENSANKSTLTMADVLKKRNNLIAELQKKSSYQSTRYNQLETHDGFDEACGGDYMYEDESLTYEGAMEMARDSREEARRQLGLRNENYQKAAEACRRKHPEIAAYYSDVAKVHIRNMEAANSTAASAFLAAQFHTAEADDTLDLHFLRVTEAVQALDIYLDNQLDQLNPGTRKTIFIITGRGARSSNGQSKIKPAVTKQLNSRNIRFLEANPGMLKVFLRKK